MEMKNKYESIFPKMNFLNMTQFWVKWRAAQHILEILLREDVTMSRMGLIKSFSRILSPSLLLRLF